MLQTENTEINSSKKSFRKLYGFSHTQPKTGSDGNCFIHDVSFDVCVFVYFQDSAIFDQISKTIADHG